MEGDEDSVTMGQFKSLWDDEEVEKLIDAVAEHQNDWDAITKVVFDGTKTQQ